MRQPLKITRRRARRSAAAKRLTTVLVLGVLVFAAVGLWAWLSGTRPTDSGRFGAPSLEVDRDRVDLGDVRLGQTVAVSFALTNSGQGPLHVLAAPHVEVVAGC